MIVESVAWWVDVAGFAAGLLISVVTAPVGVSGAVFLLPVQVSLLGVPSPSVTPTNLLFNVVAAPGALAHYRRLGELGGPLTRQLMTGTLPGVVLGAIIRVFAVPGPRVFHLLVAAFLLPLGVWLCMRTLRRPTNRPTATPLSHASITILALIVGVLGGIYGIGGGSILGPILAGRGIPIATVAPAALASTFLTSLAGAATYALLSLTTHGTIAPDWSLGIACGAGGLFGGYLGARLQPHLPETMLRLLLGALAVTVAGLYLAQGLI